MSLRPPRPVAKASAGVTAKPTDSMGGEGQPQAKRSGLLRAAAVRNICAKNLRPSEKSSKLKHPHRMGEEIESEKKLAMTTVSLAIASPDIKVKTPASGETSSFKQSPKRLKMCKGDGDPGRIKKPEWKKEMAVEGPSAASVPDSPIPSAGKKRLLKRPTQLSPLKYKKSLEKRRNSEKKTKILYKKASKLAVSSSELSKTERKRRNPLP